MRKRQQPEPIRINRLASRISVLTDVPYEHTSRTIKALLILMAHMNAKELQTLLGRYKKFLGFVPDNLDKIHE